MNFNELCLGCRTYRRFQPKEIDAGILDELMENVRIANSAMNAQVLRYVLVREPSLTAAMQPLIHWAGALPPELGTPKAGETPVAFVLICKEGRGNPWDDIDVGIAARTITLNAYAHGIGSAMLGAVEIPKVKELLSLPADWNPRLLIALGYPGCESHIVGVPENGSIKYFLDDKKDYCVPKRQLSDICIKK